MLFSVWFKHSIRLGMVRAGSERLFSVWFKHSTTPSVWGWYGLVQSVSMWSINFDRVIENLFPDQLESLVEYTLERIFS